MKHDTGEWFTLAVAIIAWLAIVVRYVQRRRWSSDNPRACPHCGGDITDQLDASYEHGYQQGYDKHSTW